MRKRIHIKSLIEQVNREAEQSLLRSLSILSPIMDSYAATASLPRRQLPIKPAVTQESKPKYTGCESARATTLKHIIQNMRVILYQLDDPRFKIKNAATLKHNVYFQIIIPQIQARIGLDKNKEKQGFVLFDPSSNFNFVSKDFIENYKNFGVKIYPETAPNKPGLRTEYGITLQNSKQKDNPTKKF